MVEPTLHALVVDDQVVVATTVAAMLEQEGFRVTVVHNGREALDVERADPCALMVTDLRMPELDGNTLIRAVRSRRPNVPIVVMTAYSELVPPEEPGRLRVLLKPFPAERLADVVWSLVPARRLDQASQELAARPD